MEGTKLEISGQANNDSHAPLASYKPISEKDMEGKNVIITKKKVATTFLFRRSNFATEISGKGEVQ